MSVTAEPIYENTNAYKVLVFMAMECASLRQSIGIMIQAPSGMLSDVTYLKKSRLKSNTAFDFLMDYDGDFDEADVTTVRTAVMNHLKDDIPHVDISSKVPFEAA